MYVVNCTQYTVSNDVLSRCTGYCSGTTTSRQKRYIPAAVKVRDSGEYWRGVAVMRASGNVTTFITALTDTSDGSDARSGRRRR